MKYLKTIYLLLCCTLALAACSDDDENSASGALSITTPAYTNVGYNKATLSANISGTEGVNIVKRGFCYATASHPDIYDTTSEVRGSEISTTLTGLTPQTTYYVRAFVTLYNEEPRYSEETSFTTPAETLSDELAAYEAPTYVDDYTSFSAWSNRYDWNLANVHDPTVMKADDGYYYMYQTDALADQKFMSLPCPACGKRTAFDTPWVDSGREKYMAISVCPQHGFVFGQMHFKRTPSNTLIMHQRAYPASMEDVEDVRERYRLYQLIPQKKRHHRLNMEDVVNRTVRAKGS